MSEDRQFWAEKCRERTDTNMCDSGSAYGYQWQRPPVDPQGPEAWWEAPSLYERKTGPELSWDPPTLSTSWYLSEWLSVDRDLNSQWEAWYEEHGDRYTSYPEEILQFLRSRDPETEELLAGNTYNEENCLSQDFWYRVYGPDDPGRDRFYSDDDRVVVISIHTGCDARSGYTSPVFCRSQNEYTIPTDLCPGLYIDEARRPRRVKYRQPMELFEHHGIPDTPFTAGPDTLTRTQCQELDEHWQPGYSSYPLSEFEQDVKRAFIWSFNPKENTICVLLKNGILARVGVQTPYLG